MLVGGLINYLIYASLVTFSQLVHQSPIIGVAIASLVSMFVNYASSSFLFLRREECKNTLHSSE
jgi:putative flippase GtrA